MLRRILGWFRGLFRREVVPAAPRRRAAFIEGDEIPNELPAIDLLVARENDTLWSAAMRCPCGCGRRLEVMLLEGVKPRWNFWIDKEGYPTLHPSIWVADGCRSHFWLRSGAIVWCKPDDEALRVFDD
jgi:hypothetical protein